MCKFKKGILILHAAAFGFTKLYRNESFHVKSTAVMIYVYHDNSVDKYPDMQMLSTVWLVVNQ